LTIKTGPERDIQHVFDQVSQLNNIQINKKDNDQWVHLNNSGEGWGVKAREARFHTPTPHFFEKLQ